MPTTTACAKRFRRSSTRPRARGWRPRRGRCEPGPLATEASRLLPNEKTALRAVFPRRTQAFLSGSGRRGFQLPATRQKSADPETPSKKRKSGRQWCRRSGGIGDDTRRIIDGTAVLLEAVRHVAVRLHMQMNVAADRLIELQIGQNAGRKGRRYTGSARQ